MRQLTFMRHIFFVGLCLLFFVVEVAAQTGDILTGSKLSSGFDMGVNSSGGRTDWLRNEGEHMKMSYPAGQSWGAVFITVGKPKQHPRPFRDFSTFDTLSVEMKGESGGQQLAIGLKTNEQPDDGSETTIPVKLTSKWQTYTFSLEKFSGVNLKKLYVVIEFVFSGADVQTVYFRNVRYLGRSATNEGGSTKNAEALLPPPPLLQGGSILPQVTISYPTDQYKINSRPGRRPSILVRGTAEEIPPRSKLFLVVHPTQNDNVWANEIILSGKEWVSQAYLGGPGGLPSNDDIFEIFTTIRDIDHPLPSMFIIQDQSLFYPSKIVTVKVKIVSWFDRAVAFGRDWQISGPISAFFAVVGTIIGTIVSRKARQNSEIKTKKDRKLGKSRRSV